MMKSQDKEVGRGVDDRVDAERQASKAMSGNKHE
jgi:hypothetical protein